MKQAGVALGPTVADNANQYYKRREEAGAAVLDRGVAIQIDLWRALV